MGKKAQADTGNKMTARKTATKLKKVMKDMKGKEKYLAAVVQHLYNIFPCSLLIRGEYFVEIKI